MNDRSRKGAFVLQQGSAAVQRGPVDHSHFPTAFPYSTDDYSVQFRKGQPFRVTGGQEELWLWTCSGQRFSQCVTTPTTLTRVFLLFALSFVFTRRGDRVHPEVEVIYMSSSPTFISCVSVNDSEPDVPIAVQCSESSNSGPSHIELLIKAAMRGLEGLFVILRLSPEKRKIALYFLVPFFPGDTDELSFTCVDFRPQVNVCIDSKTLVAGMVLCSIGKTLSDGVPIALTIFVFEVACCSNQDTSINAADTAGSVSIGYSQAADYMKQTSRLKSVQIGSKDLTKSLSMVVSPEYDSIFVAATNLTSQMQSLRTSTTFEIRTERSRLLGDEGPLKAYEKALGCFEACSQRQTINASVGTAVAVDGAEFLALFLLSPDTISSFLRLALASI
ncbi:uncharacterized protein CLUP02_01041 [Colletotrichum lupini]|uniref:Uncharacterized protein n=1 Tax=Colletotrichum lupini TaxID=145971 RepID=A0A9Q8W8X0_9PEZI|nr:uncharacterized protein CLUP02_01041 [Colletotrichum lupini]UQC74391.1 hypothetical protein CLUP02_01041 [Colletotrichum lupini]